MTKKTTTQRGGRKTAKPHSPAAAGAGDWREAMIARIRGVVMGANAGVFEEVK